MTDLNKIIDQLAFMRDSWRRDALASVPDDWAIRNMHDKYLNGDNEAAGQYACAEELDQVIQDLENLNDQATKGT